VPEQPSFSFPKIRLLVNASEFERVRRDGSVCRGKLILLGLLKIEDGNPFRAGFIVSRRVGSAVIRNRVRRRLREIVRRHQHQLHENFWLVIIARPEANRASYGALEDEFLRLAKRDSILTA
jgi:ribonuclease P protein component